MGIGPISRMSAHSSRSTRSTLLRRLKNWDDEQSWSVFVERYGSLIYTFALKAGLTDTEAQDIRQETLIEVTHRIKTFEYNRERGSFKAWLFRLTRWRISNQFQKRHQGVHCVAVSESVLDQQSADSLFANAALNETWEQEWREVTLHAAMEKLRKEIPAKHFQVLQGIVQSGWSVSEIARVFRMNRGHVYLLKFRGVARLKAHIARLEQGRL